MRRSSSKRSSATTIGRRIRFWLAGEAGHAFVELALVMPIFTLLIVGGAEFARLAFAGIEVANAARAGVQYGSETHFTAMDSAGIITAAQNDGSNLTNMTATTKVFCACSTDTSTVISCSTQSTSCTRLVEFVQVNTSATVNPIFRLPKLPKTYTLKGQAIMRVVQ